LYDPELPVFLLREESMANLERTSYGETVIAGKFEGGSQNSRHGKEKE
jgi:hypothetical protein